MNNGLVHNFALAFKTVLKIRNVFKVELSIQNCFDLNIFEMLNTLRSEFSELFPRSFFVLGLGSEVSWTPRKWHIQVGHRHHFLPKSI